MMMSNLNYKPKTLSWRLTVLSLWKYQLHVIMDTFYWLWSKLS